MLNVGDSLSAALTDLTLGAREGGGAHSSSSDADAGQAAPVKSAAAASHTRSSSAKTRPPPPPQDEAIPKRNGAMGLYPLRSGLAQEGDANPEMGYFGGSA
jgi:hypothetical protein